MQWLPKQDAFSNVLQANTKILQYHSLRFYKLKNLHCNLLQTESKCSLKKTGMINLAENNRNLPKPSLADHRVPEPPSERVSIDVNTLLSQSNFLSLRTTYPTGRFYKNGWLEKHNTCSTPESKKQIIDSCHRRLPCCRLNKVEKRLEQKLRQRYCKLWNRWR